MTQPEDRRSRKRERTRNDLMDAARTLITEKGVADFRVSDVTERSDIGLGSFYSHFAAKEDIVTAIVDDTVGAVADAIGDVGDLLPDPAEALAVGVRRLVGLCETEPELVNILVRLEDAEPRFERILWERAERIMIRGVKDGRFVTADPGLSLRIAIAAVLATIRAVQSGAAGPLPAITCSLAVLQSLGIPPDRAAELTARTLPPMEDNS